MPKLQTQPLRPVETLVMVGLFLVVASSALILFEPAPTDYLLIAAAMVWLFARPKRWLPLAPLLAIGAWILPELAQIAFRRDLPDPEIARHYVLLDTIMALLVVFVASVARSHGTLALYLVLTAFVLSAMVSVVPPILTLLGILGSNQTLYYNLRFSGFFNYQGGTNDFGVFMAIAVVFCLYLAIHSPLRWRVGFYFLAPILLSGLIFSYSRAAWMVMGIALVLLLLFNFFDLRRFRLAGLLVTISFALALIPISQQPRLWQYLESRLGLQYYDQQRFSVQLTALKTALTTPFGVGVGQEEALLDYAVHSLYIGPLYENGWLSFLGLVVFFGLTLQRLARALRTHSPSRPIFVMLTALIIGLLINGLVVNTIEARFQWLVLALAWGEYD